MKKETVMRRRIGRRLAVPVVALLVVIGGTSVAAAAIDRDRGAESFVASFDARAVADPTVESCPDLGPEGQKIEARYEGTFTIPTQEDRRLAARFSLEILLDRSTGIGTAEGNWRLESPPDSEIVGRGALLAVVTTLDPPDPDLDPPDPDLDPPDPDLDPPDPDLELRGLLIGLLDPPDPDLPAQRLLGSFTASLDEGATFPHLKGTVGDPTVGDPTGLTTNPAALLPAVKC